MYRELHLAIDQGKKRVVFTHAYIFTRMKDRTTLANQNIARGDGLAAKPLYPKSFGL